MLHKSFKPAKCKTALKLAASRIKLLKNKREAQVKQLKREVAQLLEAGQDQTARIRVEHVVREEKTMAAYELIEIYCELIAARLPIIESQKNCPIDLKEAIASVIFASPRCADIPELADVRKYLTAKYGKEFASGALELRPDCGVSRLLVEKMSAKAPDGPTKIKILTAIAGEHNINWDPNSFDEKYNQTPSDLLDGPGSFQEASNFHEKPPPAQHPVNNSDFRQSNFPVPARTDDIHSDPYGLDSRPSGHSDWSNNSLGPGISHPDLRQSGITKGHGAERAEIRNPDQHGSGFSSSRHSWPMEFKDAASAAQAAAESAERASIAARAAAELSSQGRISWQHVEESSKSPGFVSGDQSRQDFTGSTATNQHLAEGPANSVYPANPQIHDDLGHGEEQDDLADLAARFYNLKNSTKTSTLSPSKSSTGSVDDFPNVNNSAKVDSYSPHASSETGRSHLSGEASVSRESRQSVSKSRAEDWTNSGKVDFFEEPSTRMQHSISSLGSSLGTIASDHNILVDHHKSEEDAENPFAVGGNMIRRPEETGSFQNDTAVFDDSGSEEGDINLDTIEEHNVHQSSPYLPPEDRFSASHVFRYRNSFSPKFSSESPFTSEVTTVSSEKTSHGVALHSDDLSPTAFDESDGPSSESEEERLIGSGSTGRFLQKETVTSPASFRNESPAPVRSSFAEIENGETSRDTWRQPASCDLDDAEMVLKTDQKTEVGDETHSRLSYGSFETRQPSERQLKYQSNATDVSHDLQISESPSIRDDVQRNDILDAADDDYSVIGSGLGSGNELNFGKLSGGFRNKGYQHRPYFRKPSTDSLSSKDIAAERLSRTMDQSSSKFDANSGSRQIGHLKVNELSTSEDKAASSDSTGDSSDEERPKQTLTTSQAPYNRRLASEQKQKSSSKSFFDSDNSDAEEDRPKQNLSRKSRVGTAISLRTKASTATSDTIYSSQSKVIPEPLASAKGTPYRRSSNPKSQLDPRSPTLSSDKNVVLERRSQDQATSRPLPHSKKFSPVEPPSKFSQATSVKQDLPPSKISDYSVRQKQPRSDEAAASKPFPESNRPSSREEYLKSSAKEHSSIPGNSAAPSSAEISAASSSQVEVPSRENSINKASHVHPKLPDYDTLTARLLALRQNQQ